MYVDDMTPQYYRTSQRSDEDDVVQYPQEARPGVLLLAN